MPSDDATDGCSSGDGTTDARSGDDGRTGRRRVDRRSVLHGVAGLAGLAGAGAASARGDDRHDRDGHGRDHDDYGHHHDDDDRRDWPPDEETPGREPGPKACERLVGCLDGADQAAVRTRIEDETPSSVSVVHENDVLGYFAVEFPSEEAAEHAHGPTIEGMDDVEYLEQNPTFEALLVPDDPLYDQQYAPQQVDAEAAWDRTLGSTDVTVAILDSGVAYTHPNLDEPYADDPGRDFVDDDGDPEPDASEETHGTLVSGVASANTNNGQGMAGLSDSRLIAGRVLDESGSGALSDIADGVQWAADAGADVINLSLGGPSGGETLRRAVAYAYEDAGSLVVAAAGNSGERGLAYPARYDPVVGVTAVDDAENVASFSNYGPNAELTAPGVNVVATSPPDGYTRVSGTSFSAPVVSGVAALGFAVAPETSASEMRTRLRETAEDLGLRSAYQGAGEVDADDLVASLAGDDGDGGDGTPENQPPTAEIVVSDADGDGTITVGETVTVDGTNSTDPDGSIASFEWAFGDGASATGAVVEHTYDAAGEYQATLTVTDDDGATATTTVTVTVEAAATCTETASGNVRGALYGWWDADRYQWSSRFESTCELSVTLNGPASPDFDLYVTSDGRQPTTSDYDAASTSADADEAVTLEDVGDSVGILVDSSSGSGYYQLSVEETGSSASTASAGSSTAAAANREDGAGHATSD